MKDSGRYQKFREHELILRDQLAIDRTKLSNDRTLMAFARTALTLFIAGVTALHFLIGEDIWWRALAWIFTLGGPIVFFIGVKRYRTMLRDIAREKEQLAEEKRRFHLKLPRLPHFHRSRKEEEGSSIEAGIQ